MAIIKRFTNKEISETFKYKGWFMFCPIYIGDMDISNDGALVVETRNFVPEFLLNAAGAYFGILCTIKTLFNPLYEPMFPFMITGEII